MADTTAAARGVHAALAGYLREGELVVAWHVTIEVVAQDGVRYLAHRAGGGMDGSVRPTVWAVSGMLESAQVDVGDQLRRMTAEVDGEEPGSDADR